MLEGTLLAGKYRLVSLLGRGGMGSVWRAQHLDLDAPVAVKLLDQAIAQNAESIARFHREAQAAAALRSPHVVQIFDRGIDEASGQPFIVMELMEGESLSDRIAKLGLLSPEQTSRIVSHIARALSRAHDAGVVHRDLKPDNVFLVRNEDEEVAKVLDFGIAKSDKHRLDADSHTRTGAVMGTPYYMSPEQISGSKGVDFRTDLWALGVIACECLTGRRPFDAETIGGLALKICAEAPPVPSRLGPVPPSFDAWFARACARESSQRFSSAREASDELRQAFGIAPTPAPGIGTNPTAPFSPVQAPTTGGLARSSADAVTNTSTRASVPAWALVGAFGTVAAVAFGAWFFFGRSPSVAADPAATAAPAPVETSNAKAPEKTPEVAPSVAPPPATAPVPVAEPSASQPAAASAAPSTVPPAPQATVAARPATLKKAPTSAPPATKPAPSSRSPSIGAAIESRR